MHSLQSKYGMYLKLSHNRVAKSKIKIKNNSKPNEAFVLIQLDLILSLLQIIGCREEKG